MSIETHKKYNIDQDISIEMYTYNDKCYLSIYNDKKDSSVAFETTKDNIKYLAGFLNQNLENV
jgi:hypothetical protein